MSMIEVEPGVRLFVQDLGEGTPVVLVPGIGMTHEAWDRQVRVLLEAGHRVIAVDQRGHGFSDKPLAGYDLPRLAADLVMVLESLGLAQVTLVGWSFGGQVAFRVAAERPDLVGRLVLVGSNAVRASRSETFPFGAPPDPVVDALIGGERADRLAARRATIRSGFGAEPDPALLDWMTGLSLQMPSWAAVACYRSMLDSDQVDLIPAVKQPVLQLIGVADPVHSARGAAWLAEQLAEARLVTLPECGHYAMLEAPDAFDAELLEFVR